MLAAKEKTYKKASPGVYRGEGVIENDWTHQLYRRKAAELLLYGRALGLSHSEAEDVLQETFLALLKLENTPENPDHYCVRVFRNSAKNLKRGWLRRIARELECSRWFEREEQLPGEQQAMRCLERLPSEQSEVIVLKLWHDLTYDEIGALVGISPNTAAGRYRYGLDRLRKCLKENEDEEIELSGDGAALVEAARTVRTA